jgi:putative transposase
MQNTTVIKINLPKITQAQTEARRESARLWNRMMKLHLWFRKRQLPWPSKGDFQKHFKGRFNLHSQTVQALTDKFFSNIDTSRTNRKNGDKSARYPHKTKRYFSTIWKGQAIKLHGNRIVLPMGRGSKPLKIKLPDSVLYGQIVEAQLGFHELRLTIKQEHDETITGDNIGSIDPGTIYLGVITDGEKSLAVSGRGLRSVIQRHNKAKAQITQLLSRCKKGSRRWKKLKRTLAKFARYRDNYQRNLLHHAANAMVKFAHDKQLEKVVFGDSTEINRNKRKNKKGSRRLNQENGNTPLGQLKKYLDYKLQNIGSKLEMENEAYTTQTCPVCGHRHKPAGRLYRCRNKDCNFVSVRDEVGTFNIRNKYINGEIVSGFSVPNGTIKYLKPVKMPVTRPDSVEAMKRPTLPANTLKVDLGASASGGKTPAFLPSAA